MILEIMDHLFFHQLPHLTDHIKSRSTTKFVPQGLVQQMDDVETGRDEDREHLDAIEQVCYVQGVEKTKMNQSNF